MVRVRFAPSPTGHLHVGAARTALFNWLYARHNRGQFILRIEDTDAARSSEEMCKGILRGLQWLALDWDEGPLFQSKRISLYRKKAEELVRSGAAYYCYCLPRKNQIQKKEAARSRDPQQTSCCCARLNAAEKRALENRGCPRAVKFKVPDRDVSYTDLIHGPLCVKGQILEDFVLLRSDGFPTYHLSVVVDDLDQRITHVIRGDDHLSNTPKQLLLYEAFGEEAPEFAHLALILGPDKKKLSKRHGVTSVLQFKDKGYLSLAMLNFLAQMSWKPGGEERIYSVQEMVQAFSLDNLYKASPVFDLTKLEWLNGQLISQMSAAELLPLVRKELMRHNLWRDELDQDRREWFGRLIDLLKPRNRTIKDFVDRGRPFLVDSYPIESEGVQKYLMDPRLPTLLDKLKQDFERLEPFSAEAIEDVLRQRAEKEGVKAALLIHALRMIVLGTKVGPGIFDVLELVGREKTVDRMNRLDETRRMKLSTKP